MTEKGRRVALTCSISTDTPTLLTPENYSFLQKEIHRESGIIVEDGKHYLLESRLMPVARRLGIASLGELCSRLRTRMYPDLTQQVTEALTTNETLFFRDFAPFEALRLTVIKGLRQQHSLQRLRIWSAAASSGQEAYSLAMLLLEMGEMRPFEIVGTDLSEQILNRAREAKYGQFEVSRGLPAIYLSKYFEQTGREWRLKNEVRKMVEFHQFDLRRSMSSLGLFHIVFCRNVLIYFDTDTKVKILNELATVVEPGGYVFLGNAETALLKMADGFDRLQIAGATAYRKR